MHRIVTSREIRKNYIVIAICAAIIVSCSLIVGWQLGRSGALSYDYLATLQRDVDRLQTENAQLRSRLDGADTLSVLGEMTREDLNVHLQSLNETNLRLQKENKFLRDILTPSANRLLTIRNLELYPTVESDAYDYSFTLSGDLKQARRGKVTVSVSGEMNGQLVVLDMPKITRPETKNLPYRFNYLQVIKGRIWLPENFVPQLFIVEEVQAAANTNTPKHLFNWMLRKEI